MSSKVLMSIKEFDLPNVKVIKTFEDMDWSAVDTFIFHSSDDTPLNIVAELTHLRNTDIKIIFINEEMNPLFYCIFTGLEADIYDSEEYLNDGSALEFLITEYRQTGLTVKTGNDDLDKLAKGIASISSSSSDGVQKLINNPYWTKSLTKAVERVDAEIVRANKVNIDVVEMLEESSKLIQSLKDNHKDTSKKIVDLEKTVSDLEKKNTVRSVPFLFSTYDVPVTVPKVLYFRVFGHCKYLSTFVLMYQNYLKMHKQRSSKVLFVLPNLKQVAQRYQNIASRIAQDSIDFIDYSSSNIFMTFEPKKNVMDAFFKQPKVEVFIVIDLMFNDPIVKGHMVETLTPISGISDISKFNLKVDRCVMSITRLDKVLFIPHINGFVKHDETNKKSNYLKNCQESFGRLDKLLFK